MAALFFGILTVLFLPLLLNEFEWMPSGSGVPMVALSSRFDALRRGSFVKEKDCELRTLVFSVLLKLEMLLKLFYLEAGTGEFC